MVFNTTYEITVMTTEIKIPEALDDVSISVFKNATSTEPKSKTSIHELLSLIKKPPDILIDQIENLRQNLMNGEEEKYKQGKKELVAVTVSGKFSVRRAADLIDHSGILQIDIDKVETPSKLRDKIAQDQHIISAFLSPSNQGVKALMLIPADHTIHKDSFLAAENYFKEHYNVQIDKSCKDLGRLMFLSYDPDLKTNPNAIPFKLPEGNLLFNSTEILRDFDSNEDKARLALEKISPDDYGTWIEVGMALKELLGETGFSFWDSWSSRSIKYDQKEMSVKWSSFQGKGIEAGTLFHYANNGLQKNHNYVSRPRKTKVRDKEEIKSLHKDYLNPQGFVGNFAKFITDNSRYPQPELALGASLALAGTLLGRKICTIEDIRTNVYVVGLALSGMGKEAARGFIKKLFSQTGISGFGAEKVTGRTAIERVISKTPSALFLIDEFGMYIRHIMGVRAPAHIREIMTTFMELFGSSSSTYFGTDKASEKDSPRFVIDQPSPCIYGTSTPSTFWDNLNSNAILDGSLNRFLIFTAPEKRPKKQKAEKIRIICDPIVKDVLKFDELTINPYDSGNLTEKGEPNPLVIPYSEVAYKIFDEFEDYTLNKADNRIEATSGMWARTAEQSKKIALIISGSNSLTEISGENAEYGCDLARLLTENTCIEIKRNLAHNDYEKTSMKVERVIRQAGAQGISVSNLTGKTRFLKNARQRAEILEDLYVSKVINKEERKIDRSQRSTTYLFCE